MRGRLEMGGWLCDPLPPFTVIVRVFGDIAIVCGVACLSVWTLSSSAAWHVVIEIPAGPARPFIEWNRSVSLYASLAFGFRHLAILSYNATPLV